MGVAGVVIHGLARLLLQGTGQQVAHPIGALHLGAVTAIGVDQPGAHGEQIFDGDLALRRVGIRGRQLGEIGSDGSVHSGQQLAVNGDSDERGNHALRCRLHIFKAGGARAVEVMFEDDLSVPARKQSVQARQAFADLDRGGEIGLAESQCRDKPSNQADSHGSLHRGHYSGHLALGGREATQLHDVISFFEIVTGTEKLNVGSSDRCATF